MPKIKKSHSSKFKFKVALASTSNDSTISEISQKFQIHASQISNWKKILLENGSQVFESTNTSIDKKLQKENEELYEQIGRLSVERDFLKKTLEL